jgi:hypothetical protein
MRTPNGLTVLSQDSASTQFVPVDVLCLLSGVNFGSVEKVLAAIAVLRESTGVDAGALASFYYCPTEKVALSNPAHTERAMAARTLVDRVTRAWVDHTPTTVYEAEYREDIEQVLHLRSRFGGR